MKNLGREEPEKGSAGGGSEFSRRDLEFSVGTIRRVVKRYPLSHQHGTVPVGEALGFAAAPRARDPSEVMGQADLTGCFSWIRKPRAWPEARVPSLF